MFLRVIYGLKRGFLGLKWAEQNMTGVATGLAMSGKIVFTYSVMRAEKIRYKTQNMRDCLTQRRNAATIRKEDKSYNFFCFYGIKKVFFAFVAALREKCFLCFAVINKGFLGIFASWREDGFYWDQTRYVHLCQDSGVT